MVKKKRGYNADERHMIPFRAQAPGQHSSRYHDDCLSLAVLLTEYLGKRPSAASGSLVFSTDRRDSYRITGIRSQQGSKTTLHSRVERAAGWSRCIVGGES
ncbi:hypothetical protein QCA50_005324 [Cerrena zonata]|uniref:Uncharacterized protein n=1 Tax=Cerrena zonata TaxID=2478898 RepID=A0AAW0GJG2_9APHY